MQAKIAALMLFVFFQVSCAEIVDNNVVIAKSNGRTNTNSKYANVTSGQVEPQSIPKPTPEKIDLRSDAKIEKIDQVDLKSSAKTENTNQINQKTTAKIRETDKLVIYTNGLSRIIVDNEYGNVLGGLTPSQLLVYRKDTVTPTGIEQIAQNTDISQSLLDSFKEANKKSEKLEDVYDVLAPVLTFSGNRDLAKFYETAKRQDSETKAVVSFSNIGIDENYAEGLIYAEYYRPDKGLYKFYFKMELEKAKSPINPKFGLLSNVKTFKMIRIN